MVQINFAAREWTVKVVYIGPEGAGTQSNLEWLRDRFGSDRCQLECVPDEGGSYLKLSFQDPHGSEWSEMQVRWRCVAAPRPYLSRPLTTRMLQGVDGLVFVADSRRSRLAANQKELENLREVLDRSGLSLDETPTVFQWNKRDLPDISLAIDLERVLNPGDSLGVEAVANRGWGVVETFEALRDILARKLLAEFGLESCRCIAHAGGALQSHRNTRSLPHVR